MSRHGRHGRTPKVLKRVLPKADHAGRRARVFLFGSWARGDARRYSDIDVAILPAEPLPAGFLLDLQEALLVQLRFALAHAFVRNAGEAA